MNFADENNESPSVSIIIPVYNGGNELLCLVDALLSQDYHDDQYEIIIVDDGSTDNSISIVNNHYPDVAVFQQHRGGSYSARNRGYKESKGDVLAFIDADCIPPKSWLTQGVQSLLKKGMDLLAGDVNMIFDNNHSIVENYDACFGINQKFYVEKYNFGVTANLFVKRPVFDAVGGFDSTLHSGGDQKFCIMAIEEGYKLAFCEKAKIDHPCRKTIKQIAGKTRRVARGRAMAFPSKGYYFPRGLAVFPKKYFFLQKAISQSKPRIGFYLLHYYLELVRIVNYAKARHSIHSQR